VVSLLVSFTLTPMLCSRFLKRPPQEQGSRATPSAAAHRWKDGGFFQRLDRHYTELLTWSVDHRQVVISVSVLTIVSIVPLFMLVGKNFRRPTINHSSTY
jgi:HAE1 family hydrophobic/amphiphilic exporter-1